VNGRAEDGATALLWAAHWNDLEAAELLIRAGADVNAANDLRITPLSLACTNGNASFVQRLLTAGANPNTPIATGETPIMTCAMSGSAGAVQALIARGADVNAKEPVQGQTALMWAALEHHPDVVKALVEHGADLARPHEERIHRAALRGARWRHRERQAARRGGSRREHRVAARAGGRFAWRTGRVGIRCARRRAGKIGRPQFRSDGIGRQHPIARRHRPRAGAARAVSAEHGADPNVESAGFTPLHWASGTWENGEANPVFGFTDAMSGIPDRDAKVQLVKALLARGAKPNMRMTSRPPAFAGGYSDVVGATPFLLAAATADVEIMRLLLAAGADPKLTTRSNATALMAAGGMNRTLGESAVTEEQALEASKLLLELGVDAKAVASNGENALFGPAYRGWNTLVQLMIDNGANVNAVSKAGITPWRAASGQGDRLGGVLFNHDTAALLVKHGADPELGKPCMAQNKCR
jgi:ankyrin repeat protein